MISRNKANSILSTQIFPSTTYIGLGSQAVSESNRTANGDFSFSEISATGYKRARVSGMKTQDGKIYNDATIFFEEITSSTTAYSFALYTSQTGGTPYLIGNLTTSVSINGTPTTGCIPIFRQGKLVVSLDQNDLSVT